MDKPRKRTDRIIDAVLVQMQTKGETISDVAKFLGKQYSQTYDWIKGRDGIPSGETLAMMAEYAGLLPPEFKTKTDTKTNEKDHDNSNQNSSDQDSKEDSSQGEQQGRKGRKRGSR